MGTGSKICVVTPSCRPENLPLVDMSIRRARRLTTVEWFVVLDETKGVIAVPPDLTIDHVVRTASAADVTAWRGNHLRNLAINAIETPESWVVMVDDDNLLSPSLVDALIKEPADTDWIIPSRVMPDGTVVAASAPKVESIDAAQIAVRRRALGSLRFGTRYEADGDLAVKLYEWCPAVECRVDVEVTYNALEAAPGRWKTIAGWLNVPTMYERVLREVPAMGRVAEVGIYAGRSSLFMFEHMKEWKKPVEYHVIDIWDDKFVRQGWEIVSRWYKPFFTEWWLPSVQAARHFADASLDAVILDADHTYEAVRDDLAAWVPKVKPGGIVVGDDYRHPVYPGVAMAVDEALGPVEFIAPMGFFWRKP